MKIFFVLLAGVLSTITTYSQSESVRAKHYNVKKGVALEEYDPVSFFDGKPLEGDEDFKFTYKGLTYYFANKKNLDRFKLLPEKYEPQYGGWCAYAMGSSGEKVKIDPETFKIIDGKLYLFYNFWGNNTLDDWNKEEKKLKEAGDKNWKHIIQ